MNRGARPATRHTLVARRFPPALFQSAAHALDERREELLGRPPRRAPTRAAPTQEDILEVVPVDHPSPQPVSPEEREAPWTPGVPHVELRPITEQAAPVRDVP